MLRLPLHVVTLLFCCFSCTPLVSCPKTSNTKTVQAAQPQYDVYTARVTYYYPEGKWGSRVTAPGVKRAVEGVTIAAHPDFKFGTEVYIPELKGIMGDGKFTVQDRGSAVTKKTAATKGRYVFDVYVSSSKRLQELVKSKPHYMKIYVLKHK